VVQQTIAESGFRTPTPPQTVAIPEIISGKNVLLIAPTGSGKTEAVLFPIFDQLLKIRDRQGISIIYITPLRALNRDLLKRLDVWSKKLAFTVEIRHGDTPQKERRRQSITPPDFLVTTPETLQAILPGKRMRTHLRHVRWVVIDEVHELAGDRRGVQLTIGLERLRKITDREFQRIGLSATVGNPDQVAGFITGGNRCEVLQVSPPKETKYFVEFPHPTDEDNVVAQSLYTAPEAAARLNRIWELVENHECGTLMEAVVVKSLKPKPTCSSCSSSLLAVSSWSTDFLRRILEKKLKAKALEDGEVDALSRARRSADLVLSYGRRAVVAQCVYGIGPQTASRILAKMHDDEKRFYKDLLEAKLRFITTRPFWDKP